MSIDARHTALYTRGERRLCGKNRAFAINHPYTGVCQLRSSSLVIAGSRVAVDVHFGHVAGFLVDKFGRVIHFCREIIN